MTASPVVFVCVFGDLKFRPGLHRVFHSFDKVLERKLTPDDRLRISALGVSLARKYAWTLDLHTAPHAQPVNTTILSSEHFARSTAMENDVVLESRVR